MASKIRFIFPLEHGLHARPASLIQETAKKFKSDLRWENDRARTIADCKSTLSLIASDTGQNDPCSIIASGPDEQKATAALKELVESVLPCYEKNAAVPDISLAGGSGIPLIIKNENPLFFYGSSASLGISLAPAFVFDPASVEPAVEPEIPVKAEDEISILDAALTELKHEIKSSRQNSRNHEEKDILNTHLSILRDETFLDNIRGHIFKENCSAELAVYRASRHFSQVLQNNRSVYIRQRMADIKDISVRLIARITGNPEHNPGIRLDAPSVLIAGDISPSQFIALDKKQLKGLVLSAAGTASHSLILAKSYNIPSITGIRHIERKINPGEEIVVDADRGLVVPSPPSMIRRFYEREIEKKEKIKSRIAPFLFTPGATSDKKKLEVAANISSVEEMETAFANGAEGIGLFRTEMIFMNRLSPPDEDEQFKIYSRAARLSGERPLIIRTLDIGGDKPIPYLNLPEESNPFLGKRAIRLYDQLHELIERQLRAILRASVFGNVKIMVPMVSCAEEIISFKKKLRKVMRQLKNRKISFNPKIPIGIMVEIPSLAFDMDAISREIDFFSIGSNDLAQYFFAADRSNPALDYLSNSLYPSFLRLLKRILTSAHTGKRWIGICGAMAGEIRLLPVLVGLGFDEISLPSPEIPMVKFNLNQLCSTQCEQLVSRLMKESTAREIEAGLAAYNENPVELDLISGACIELKSKAISKNEAIRELVDLLDISGRLTGCDEVEEAIWLRESTYSTAIGFGIAIPHCRCSRVRYNSIAFSRLVNPIPWQSPDNQKVDTVILIAISAGRQDKEHLKIISRLSRGLMNKNFRAALRRAKQTGDIVNLLNESLEIDT